MKTLFLFTLTIILSTNLKCKRKPFEVTNAYEEESLKFLNQTENLLENPMQENAIYKRNARKDVKKSTST